MTSSGDAVPHPPEVPPPPRTHHDVLHGSEAPLDEATFRKRELKHALVAEARRINEHLALLDAHDCAEDELQSLREAATALADRLEPLPSLRRYGGAALGPMGASALDERSPISGQGNPVAPPMYVESDGQRTWGHAVYGPAYEGPPTCVHGGWVAAAFDELLGVTQAMSGTPGMTGTLTIRMRRPTRLGLRVDYEGTLVRVEGRKIFTTGTAHCDGELLAEAEGIFVSPRNWVGAFG